MVHPNYLGTFQFFASVDSATGTVSFSESKRRDKNTLEAISTPLMLIVLAKECFEQFDGFIKQVADLQHSREPVDGRSRMILAVPDLSLCMLNVPSVGWLSIEE